MADKTEKGFTTYCNPYDLERGDGHVLVEGVEADKAQRSVPTLEEEVAGPEDGVMTTKVVAPKKKPAAKKTTASTKDSKKS